MISEQQDFMNIAKPDLQKSYGAGYNTHDLQYAKAQKIYGKYSELMFGDLSRPKKMWRDIIYRKMFSFSTGLEFNFSNKILNNWELMYSMGYFGGVSWGYWTNIALLQYYLDPRWVAYPSVPDFGRHDSYDEGVLHRRIDGDAGNLASTAATGLMGVLLPDGLRSFKMAFKKTRRVLARGGNDALLLELDFLEIVATELLTEKLTDITKKYYSKITALMQDYLNYGTCVALLEPCASSKEHYDFTYIPFVESGLASTDYDVTQIGSWIQPLPLVNAYANKLDDTGGITQGFINHFYLPGDQFENGDPSKFYELNQYTRHTASVEIEPHIIREVKRYKDYSPLLVARYNDKGQMYGVGAGLKALNSIVLANMYTNCSKLAAMGSFFPACAFSNDSTVKQNNQTSGNYMSHQSTEIINAMPGSKIIVGSSPGVERTGMPPMTILSKPPEQMQVFFEASSKCLESIASTYLVTLLDRLATIGQKRDVTAEEVIRQDNRDSQRFKATIEPFYCGIIHPLVEATASLVLNELFSYYAISISKIREADNQFLIKHSFNIDIFNYEKKQNMSERMSNAMQYAQIKKDSGQEVPEVVEKIINQLGTEMIK